MTARTWIATHLEPALLAVGIAVIVTLLLRGAERADAKRRGRP